MTVDEDDIPEVADPDPPPESPEPGADPAAQRSDEDAPEAADTPAVPLDRNLLETPLLRNKARYPAPAQRPSPSPPPRDLDDHPTLRADRRDAGRPETPPPTEAEAAAEVQSMVDGIALPPSARMSSHGAIAHGGMGTIEEITDAVLRRRLAMKVIHERLQTSPSIVEMFIREAQITGQLDHPNIVPVHELGLDPAGRLYFTMKLVEGRTLAEMIKELPPGEIEYTTLLNLLDVVVKVCDALALAHSRGVVHCDIKPENIMVGEFGEVYLMDWGLARSGECNFDPGTFVGTPAYMSPEQASGDNQAIDPRSDVFGIGAILYELIARRPPFDREGFWQSVAAAADCDFPALDESSTTVPRGLIRITRRAMAREPAQRYQNAGELKQMLVRFMRGGGQFPTLRVAAGTKIVCEGAPGDVAYIIVSGQCRVDKLIDGETQSLRTMGPGDVFGETAILSPGPRTATVVATEPMTLRVVTRDVLEAEVDSMKPWMGAFIRALAARFREREDERGTGSSGHDE